MGLKIKWQAIIPLLFFVISLGAVLMFRKKETKQTVRTTNNQHETPLSKPDKKQADNDEQATFDAATLPKGMSEKVKESFPDVNLDAIQWVNNKRGWEAQFESSGQEIEMEFDKNGNWLETELENVPRAMIPQVVIAAIQQRFPMAQFKEFEIENTPEGTFYEVEIIDDGKEREVYYSAKGEKKMNFNED